MSQVLSQLREEMQEHLTTTIIPFWKNLRDDENGGYYGYMDYDLGLDQKAEKGCILNSRITWFFSNAYMLLKDESLLEEAKHGYAFMKEHCFDHENGGIYWSLDYQGKPLDTTKHTYNQAFCIYALSSYYDATGDEEALAAARDLFDVIESKCRDEGGYLEAFTVDFKPASNEKLSENGVMATRTMNTLLHVLEAYTELYRVAPEEKVAERLRWILDACLTKIYNPELHRQEVFFDHEYNTLIDLYSCGHDIETSWLIDRAAEVLQDPAYRDKMNVMTTDLANETLKVAFDGHSMAPEIEKGVMKQERVWWVQAETVVGFLNAWQKDQSRVDYLNAALAEWDFIKEFVVDKREGSEWFWEINPDGSSIQGRPIVEPWKCPYHNGRMCMEVIKRLKNA